MFEGGSAVSYFAVQPGLSSLSTLAAGEESKGLPYGLAMLAVGDCMEMCTWDPRSNLVDLRHMLLH